MKKHFLIALILVSFGHLKSQHVGTFTPNPNRVISDAMIFISDHEILASDYDNGRVSLINIKTGQSRYLVTGLGKANGLYLSPITGHLYIANPVADKIYVVDTSDQTLVQTINMQSPSDIIASPNHDTLYISSWQDNRISQIEVASGTDFTWQWGAPLNAPVGLCYDPQTNDYYVGNFNDRKIYRMNDLGIYYVATVPAPNTTGNAFLGFIKFANNKIYASSLNAHQIYEIDPAYTDSVKLLAGQAGISGNQDGSPAIASFSQPNGVLPNAAGDTIWISEYGSGNLRYYTTSSGLGTLKLKAGSEGLSIYPQPATDHIQLEINEGFEDLQKQEFQLINSSGQVLKSGLKFQAYQNQALDLSGLSPGTYFIQYDYQGESLSQQILIH
ncbi:T9SS type A sorting domain-containing protein [Croceimicrobium hydrocarbonivorans]|uniref:T9SS type A sorting domain-containing protein n=1 Tax=Croceimicrobium hydrocarbonivorans TaxID=2761580 RepID=A0A7H0VIP1_9FLAO|nr:T9SS type A sorting domain-containing protein [Croceimicrobium hydrocarbonivorans]QNR25589.1 T9SS type A sorting domain-containing protein [Croceimicrobium hydrocarbonivorans]